MIAFELAGKKIEIKFGFFLIAAITCLVDFLNLGFMFLSACVIHEAGHVAAACFCNVKITKITFDFNGIKMIRETKITGILSDIVILMAGPLFNFICSIVYYENSCYEAFSVHLILGAFNMLPFSNLDGGSILKNILEYLNCNSEIIMKAVVILTVIILCLFFYITDLSNPFIYATVIFLGICELSY